MHDYNSSGNAVSNPAESAQAVSHGDAWLQTNIDPYLQWAQTHNSLLILTFDEDSTADWITPPLTQLNYDGMTSPNLGPNPGGNSGPNQITMMLAGAAITPGNYSEGAGVTNVNLLRTIESFYGLSAVGDQAPLATDAGISNTAITDVFAVPEPSAFQLETMLGLVSSPVGPSVEA